MSNQDNSIDRREFLRRTGTAVASVALASRANGQEPAGERSFVEEHSEGSDKKRLLLLSNTKFPGQPWFGYAKEWIQKHFDASPEHPKKVLFIPYAMTDKPFIPGNTPSDPKMTYTKKATDSLKDMGIDIVSVEGVENPVSLLDQVDGVLVGGGNTFRLLKKMQETGLDKAIKAKVEAGMPFMGSSAGINVAGPTIMTTNDMPIVQPKSMDAMGLVPFQINPHYVAGKFYYGDKGSDYSILKNIGDRLDRFTEKCKEIFNGKDEDKTIVERLKGLLELVVYNGETRDERLTQFLEENTTPVVALREGGALSIRGNKVELLGGKPAKIFEQGKDPIDVTDGKAISLLMPSLEQEHAKTR